jgi:hypothetical protein
MSLADNAEHRAAWQRKAAATISQIEDLRRELEIALRQQPIVDIGWRLAAASLRCAEARAHIRQAIGTIYQIE